MSDSNVKQWWVYAVLDADGKLRNDELYTTEAEADDEAERLERLDFGKVMGHYSSCYLLLMSTPTEEAVVTVTPAEAKTKPTPPPTLEETILQDAGAWQLHPAGEEPEVCIAPDPPEVTRRPATSSGSQYRTGPRSLLSYYT
jgi:hypothetical protein